MIPLHYYRILSFLVLIIAFGFKPMAQTKLFEDIELNTVHNYRITQDHDGYIWMIGEKGITKYDGTNVRIFTTNDGLPANDIWNIRITDDNKVWFFSSAKEHGYIYKDSVYKFSAEEETLDLFPFCVVQYKNKVGFYNNHEQLVELVNDKWIVVNNFEKKDEFLLNSKYANSIYYKNDSAFIKTNKNETFFITKTGINSPYFNIYPNEILFLVIDNLIQVIELNSMKIHLINLDDYDLNLKNKIGISYLNNSYQLTGFNFVVDLDNEFKVTNINKSNPKFESYYSMRDKLDNIWILSFNNGVYFKSYSETKSKNYNIGSTKELKSIDGKIHFIVKKKYFGRLENDKVEIKYKNDNENDIYTYIVLNKEINLFNNKKTVLDFKYNWDRTKKLANVKRIMKIKNSYYISNNYDSEEIDSNFNTITRFSKHIKDIVDFNDTLFIATYDGLYYRDKDDFIKHFINFNYPINSLAVTKSSLIIGSDGHGLFEYKKGRITKIYKNISFIEAIKVYSDTNILAATNRGLYSITNRSNRFELNYIYNINDGLKSNLINDVLLKNDILYIATSKGITSIGNKVKNQQQLQSIHINKVKWNESLIKDSIINVKYSKNNALEINFSSINYNIKNYLSYSYKLIPGQNKFIKIPKGQINLNNLPIGEHQLIIKVENEKNFVLKKKLVINIKPNWYQTSLFKSFLLFLTLFFIYLFIVFYKKRLSLNADKRIEQERKLSNFKLQALRSQMNPHFVFNSLNAIQYYMNENDLEMSDKYLLKFSRLIRQFFDLSSVQEIPIDKEIELLTNYLDIERMRFLNKLDYIINIDQKIKSNSYLIPTMILQPIVENAINHGIFHKRSKGTVTLEFKSIDKTSYQVIIKDDGIGIKKSKEIKENSIQGHNSKSTIIFKERISLLNKSNIWNVKYSIHDIDSTMEQPGTIVTLIFTKL